MNEARNIVGWFEIYVKDIARARNFYENVFDIKLEDLKMEGIEMLMFPGDGDKPGCNGALVKMQARQPSDNGTLVYFSSLDCSVEEQRIKQSGGIIVQSKQDIGEHGFTVLAKDMEGNIIGIHSLR